MKMVKLPKGAIISRRGKTWKGECPEAFYTPSDEPAKLVPKPPKAKEKAKEDD